MLGLFGPKGAEIGTYRTTFVYQGPFKEDSSTGSRVINEVVLERLSEKGSEGGFEGGFGRYEETEMGPKEPSRWSVGLRQGCFQGFSDSLRIGILRSSRPEMATWQMPRPLCPLILALVS